MTIKPYILYTLDSKGKLRYKKFIISKIESGYQIERASGLKGGTEVPQPTITIDKGKAKRTVLQQAELEYNSIINKYLDKGYKKLNTLTNKKFEELTPEEMKSLGAFFQSKSAASQPVQDADLVAVGKFIFHRGNQFSGLPSCSSCHGAKGLGTPQLPRLAGQHPRYIEDQLKQFHKRERTNDNAVMHTVASRLSEMEAHAVAEYIATLQ